MPIPLKSCGSVSARLSVWLSRVSAARTSRASVSSGSMPPGSSAASPARRRRRGAKRASSMPASVKNSVPSANSNDARTICGQAALRPRLAPSQPAGDHQMDDQKQIRIEAQHDALAETTDAPNGLTGNGVDRRGDRTKHEGAAQSDAFENAAGDLRRQGFDVDHDVWKFRHSAGILPWPGNGLHGYRYASR